MWLKGQSTWSAITPLLTQLIAGEVADGSSNIVPAADAWPRAIAGQDLLVPTDTSHDFNTGNINFRAGYFYNMCPANTNGSASPTWIKATNVFTSAPATSNGRWIMYAYVYTANTVANNYSNAQILVQLLDADTGTGSGAYWNPNAAGVVTYNNGFQFQVGDPSGFLTANGNTQYTWWRAFDTTYMGGVDFWGYSYPKRRGNATFSVNPTGTSGTDWDANISRPTAYTFNMVNSYWAGGLEHGLGIKTNTGLSGNQYTLSYNVCPMSLRLENDATTAGQIRVGIGQAGAMDTTQATPPYRTIGYVYTYNCVGSINNDLTPSWLRTHQTSTSVTAGSIIQYWLSVKKDKIVIVLNADPGQTGKLTMNMVQYHGNTQSFDKQAICWGYSTVDYTGSSNPGSAQLMAMNTLGGQQLRQNGSEARDWQTGWGRGDQYKASDTDGCFNFVGPHFQTHLWSSIQQSPYSPNTTKPAAINGAWNIFSFPFYDVMTTTQNSPSGTLDPEGTGWQRGIVRGLYWLPSAGWANGDELTDTSTGNTYFLISPDYPGFMGRQSSSAPFYGGIAILEE